jgi:hypothetical protein
LAGTNFKKTAIGLDQLYGLFQCFSKITSVSFNTRIHKSLQNANGQAKVPFDETDIEDFDVRVKQTNLLSLSMGFYLKDKATMKYNEDRTRMLLLARDKFLEALETTPEDCSILREIAEISGIFPFMSVMVYSFIRRKLYSKIIFRNGNPRRP